LESEGGTDATLHMTLTRHRRDIDLTADEGSLRSVTR